MRQRLSRLRRFIFLCVLTVLAACSGDGPTLPVVPEPDPDPVDVTVPAITREFRGLWIATVANIDWPSRSGLSMTAQQDELIAILDRAQTLRLNAVLLQVRAAGDAMYPSTLEPWSRSLMGVQGTAPGWDPLSFAVAQAHARGIELHAWFNPFRAGNVSDTAQLSALHFARRRPDLVRTYCTQRWFDPGEHDVHAHTYAVIRDVMQRYDIDAVHSDDFFYPYPDSRCAGLQFPDSATYARYLAAGGTLSRNDWRRDNVNRFVQQLQEEVRAESPTVRVGISPFGIWRPGSPSGVVGLDAYASIFADSRLWLTSGWVDYLAPQLYWSRSAPGQSFTALIDWWTQQNTQRRHLWPGLAAYRVADGSSSAYLASEIEGQVAAARARSAASGGPTGTILYNTTSVVSNRGGLGTLLETSVHTSSAVVPSTSWLSSTAPAIPAFTVSSPVSGSRTVNISRSAPAGTRWWLVRWRDGTSWRSQQVHSSVRAIVVPPAADGQASSVIVVNALSDVGVESQPSRWTP